MTQSWLVGLYLDCPQDLLPVLHCPNASAIAEFEAAVKMGDIWWHAFPHNAELAAAGAGMIEYGLDITHKLDERFGLKPRKTLSQRDVPGITRAALPILARAGVPYISLGTNNGPYKPVGIPNAFVWRDPTSGSEAIVTWHNMGYGSVQVKKSLNLAYASRDTHTHTHTHAHTHTHTHTHMFFDLARTSTMYVQGDEASDPNRKGAWQDCQDGQTGCEDGLAEPSYLQIPGHDEALVLGWRSDNQGPPGCKRGSGGTLSCNVADGVTEVTNDFAAVRKLFPGASIVSSDLDDFMQGLEAHKSSLKVGSARPHVPLTPLHLASFPRASQTAALLLVARPHCFFLKCDRRI
jgi:hypothetical protein